MAHRVIALWTTPRSRSTAFERMMIERGDHTVIDEPFSARYYFSTERRSDRFEESEPAATGEAVLSEILDAAADRPVFVKDMAYHATGLLSAAFLAHFTNTFLIREPTAALASLARRWPDHTSEEAGYEALGAAFDLVGEQALPQRADPPIVIDADELVADPRPVIAAWCEAVGIPDDPDALTWRPGMVPEWTRWQDWYAGVAQSSGFVDRTESLNPLEDQGLSERELHRGGPAAADPTRTAVLARATAVYERLAAVRIRGGRR